MDGVLRSNHMAAFLDRFRFDLAILIVSGIGVMGEFIDDQNKVAIVQAALARTNSVILAANSSKSDTTARMSIDPVSGVDDIVTDSSPNARMSACVNHAGVTLRATCPQAWVKFSATEMLFTTKDPKVAEQGHSRGDGACLCGPPTKLNRRISAPVIASFPVVPGALLMGPAAAEPITI